jgi:hypothetical protein
MNAKAAGLAMIAGLLLLSGCNDDDQLRPTQVAGEAIFRILVGDMPGACRYYTDSIKTVCEKEAVKVNAINGKVKRNVVKEQSDVLADFNTIVTFPNGNEAQFNVKMAKIRGKWVIENGAWNDIRTAIEEGAFAVKKKAE